MPKLRAEPYGNMRVTRAVLARKVGAQLRRLREERGMSQRALAAELGLDQARLSGYETGKVLAPLLTLLASAEVLDVLVDELFRAPEELADDRAALLRRFRQVIDLGEMERQAASGLLDLIGGLHTLMSERRGRGGRPAPPPPDRARLDRCYREIDALAVQDQEAAALLLELAVKVLRFLRAVETRPFCP